MNLIAKQWLVTNRITAWMLAIAMLLLFISGYGLIGEVNIDKVMAFKMHKVMAIAAIALFLFHATYSYFILKRH